MNADKSTPMNADKSKCGFCTCLRFEVVGTGTKRHALALSAVIGVLLSAFIGVPASTPQSG